MHGKILIIDPIATNRIVLKVKLSSAYYNVSQAASIAEAKEAIEGSRPDVVITSGQMPDGTASDLTVGLRKHATGSDIPIIVIACDDNQERRLALLSAGVDAILSRPLNDAMLLARVRSLVRSHAVASEWRLHDDTSRALGFAEKQATFRPTGKVILVAYDKDLLKPWIPQLSKIMPVKTTISGVEEALDHLDNTKKSVVPDVFVLLMDQSEPQKILHLLATLKSLVSTRHCGILIVQTHHDQTMGAQALDMGANDLMPQGFHPREMALRVNALLRRKQVEDQMRATVRNGLEAAVSDPLTGLHNRRYAMPHLDRIAQHAYQTVKPFAVMIADMDHFKRINDTYGHAAGDAVLIEMARRLRENMQTVDMIARIGGEEFLIVLPSASLGSARNAARKLCKLVGETPFSIPGKAKPITATISIGLTFGGSIHGSIKTAHQLLDEADRALYMAKDRGRNCVTLSRPAA